MARHAKKLPSATNSCAKWKIISDFVIARAGWNRGKVDTEKAREICWQKYEKGSCLLAVFRKEIIAIVCLKIVSHGEAVWFIDYLDVALDFQGYLFPMSSDNSEIDTDLGCRALISGD